MSTVEIDKYPLRIKLAVYSFVVFSIFILSLSAYVVYTYREENIYKSQPVVDDGASEFILSECFKQDNYLELFYCLFQNTYSKNMLLIEEKSLLAQQDSAVWSLSSVILSAVSLLVTGVGLVYVALTLYEARVTSRTSIRAVEAANASVAEARRAAEAAIAAVEVAREALSTERAWLDYTGFQSFTLVDAKLPGGKIAKKTFGFKFNFRNDGRSPAIDVRMYHEIKVVKAAEPLPTFQHSFSEEQAITPMGPGVIFNSTMDVVEENSVESIVARESKIIGYVRVDYRDIIAKLDRFTETCVEIYYDGEAIEGGRRIVNWSKMLAGPQNNMA